MRSSREENAYRAALMYYVHGQTMEAIAHKLKVSRSTVSRLIEQARERGYVQFVLTPPSGGTEELQGEISHRFGVEARVVPVSPRTSPNRRLQAVAEIAGNLITQLVVPDVVIGVAWGNTLSAVAENLVAKPVSGATIVQLNGAGNRTDFGIAYAGGIMEAFGQAYHASVQPFPVPAFFNYPETKTSMWRERSVRIVLDLQKHVDVAVFGVGTLRGAKTSHVYSGGFLSTSELLEIMEDGVVGDICTVLLRQDGTWRDLAVNQRASGPTPDILRQVPRRICVVSGRDKAVPTLAALRAGVVTDLILDDESAAKLLKIS